MTTLREQIEGLTRYISTAHGMEPEPDERFAGWVKFREVVRIIAAHDDSDASSEFAEFRRRLLKILKPRGIDNGLIDIELAQIRMQDLAQVRKEIAALRARLVPIPDVTLGGIVSGLRHILPNLAEVSTVTMPDEMRIDPCDAYVSESPVGQTGGEEFRPLPRRELRAVHRAWRVQMGWTCYFSSEGELYRGAHWAADHRDQLVNLIDPETKFAPIGKTWAEVYSVVGYQK